MGGNVPGSLGNEELAVVGAGYPLPCTFPVNPSPAAPHAQTAPLALQEHPQPFLCQTNIHHVPRTCVARVYTPSMGHPAQETLILVERHTGSYGRAPSLSSPRPLRRAPFSERVHALIRKTHCYVAFGVLCCKFAR